MLKVGIWVENIMCAGIIVLQWKGWNFAHGQHLYFPTFNLYTAPAKLLYPQRYSIRFSKTLIPLEDGQGGRLGGKFHVRRCYSFVIARRKICASINIANFPLSNCTLSQQKSYIFEGVQPILESFYSAQRCSRCAFRWKISCAQVL